MCRVFHPRAGGGAGLRVALVIVSVLAAGGAAAWACVVDVEGGDSFNSINDALATLDKEVRNRLNISGTCTEAVVIDGFSELVVWAAPGAGIVRPVPGSGEPEQAALTIKGSRVSVEGLTIEGPGLYGYSPALVIVSRSSLFFGGCTIRDSAPATGLDAQDHSDVQIIGTTVADNGTGIAAGTSAHVQISNFWGDLNTIENNGSGISASRDALVEVGLAIIRNNTQGAVGASNGAAVNLGSWGWGQVTVTGNGLGDPNDPKYPNNPLPAVQASDGGIIWVIQPTAIVDNYGTGVGALSNGRVYVCCGASPEDTPITGNGGWGFDAWMGGGIYFWGPALVEGNLRGGVSVDSSEAYLCPAVLIFGNGDSSDPDSFGGLAVGTNARVQSSATVIDNHGPGVFISTGATADFGPDAVISGNRGYGVELEAASTAMFMDGATVNDNRGFDLVCSSGSVAGAPQGMHPVIGKKKCPTWTQLRGYPAWLEYLNEP